MNTYYDYMNQAYVIDGKYTRCGHPESMDCDCYGKLHEGEPGCPHTSGETEKSVNHYAHGDMVIGGHSDYFCNSCGTLTRQEYSRHD